MIQAAYDLMNLEGTSVCGSAGCIVKAVARFCDDLDGENKSVNAVPPDGGRAYMSTICGDSRIEEKLPDFSGAFQTYKVKR